jgi:hypothetical protein
MSKTSFNTLALAVTAVIFHTDYAKEISVAENIPQYLRRKHKEHRQHADQGVSSSYCNITH